MKKDSIFDYFVISTCLTLIMIFLLTFLAAFFDHYFNQRYLERLETIEQWKSEYDIDSELTKALEDDNISSQEFADIQNVVTKQMQDDLMKKQ